MQATDPVGRGHLERLCGRRRSTDRVEHVSTSALGLARSTSVLLPSGQRSALVSWVLFRVPICLLCFVMANELVSRLGLSRSLTASPTHARSLARRSSLFPSLSVASGLLALAPLGRLPALLTLAERERLRAGAFVAALTERAGAAVAVDQLRLRLQAGRKPQRLRPQQPRPPRRGTLRLSRAQTCRDGGKVMNRFSQP